MQALYFVVSARTSLPNRKQKRKRPSPHLWRGPLPFLKDKNWINPLLKPFHSAEFAETTKYKACIAETIQLLSTLILPALSLKNNITFRRLSSGTYRFRS